MQKDLEPNDVCVILRPNIEDNKWTGNFTVMVAGFGPITLSSDEMDVMIGIASVLSSVIPFMEENNEVAEMLFNFTKEYLGENALQIDYNPDHDSFNEKEDQTTLSVDTKTVGGVH